MPPRRLGAEIFDKHNDYATQNCKDENHGTSSPLTRDSGVVLRKISDCQLLLAVTLLFVYVSPRHFLHASKRAKMSSIGNQKISDELHSFGAIAQQSFSNDDLHIYRLQSGLFKNDFMILRKLNASKSLCFLPHLSITDMSNSD